MGQRHQVFIHMVNPVKFEWAKHWDDIKTAKAECGSGKTTVIALHHQWNYGRAPLVTLMNIMDYTDPELIQQYSSPFSPDVQVNSYEDWKQQLMMMIQVQANKLHPRGLGIERMHFLNDKDYPIREYCDRGDNNDGITIVDIMTRKYCFMNIYDYSDRDWYDPNEKFNSASDLPVYQPVSAHDYVTAYYPKLTHKRFTRPLAKYEVLTKDELSVIFPKMEQFKTKKEEAAL